MVTALSPRMRVPRNHGAVCNVTSRGKLVICPLLGLLNELYTYNVADVNETIIKMQLSLGAKISHLQIIMQF